MPSTPLRGRVRWLTVAACVALVIGIVVVSDVGGPDGQEVVTAPEPDAEPDGGSLDLAGPTDGRQSVGVPVEATPSTMLVDGQTVSVTGTGFVPGEAVGIVQCTAEAARVDRGGEAAGVDACDLTPYTALEADDLGGVTGTYAVQRTLTTSWTGTIDCAERPGRCIVVIGSVSDYDRSGGFGVSFATEGLAPLDVPVLSVSPSEDLADGDIVLVTGSRFPAGAMVSLSLCSLDPSTCWTIGAEEGEPTGVGRMAPTQAVSDGAGGFEVTGALWRYLPGPDPGTYVDCALSPCAVRATVADAAPGSGTEVTAALPAPVRVGFRGGGDGPTPASIAVSPTEGVAVGDVVTVSGAGFRPGEQVLVMQCAVPEGEGAFPGVCEGISQALVPVADDGAFQVAVETVPLRSPVGSVCDESGCGETSGDDLVDCADGTWTCDIRVHVDDLGGGRPPFLPSPVELVIAG